MKETIRVLVSLHPGYGLGDAVAMSAVLQHVRKYRPNWQVDYQAEPGKEVVGRGIVDNIFCYGEHYPSPYYDAEVQICLYDTWANWPDRPNTRVTAALHERFDIPWDEKCGRYIVNIRPSIYNWAKDAVPIKSVGVHYRGDSAQQLKNLSEDQASYIYQHIGELGFRPYPMGRNIPKGYDAEVNCAIISQCRAFIGIDSGPSKCASATNTPSLVVWTGHHPAQFHDPAPNTTHLVPVGYHSLHPVCNDPGVIKWFEAHYNVLQYENNDPLPQIRKWLEEILK